MKSNCGLRMGRECSDINCFGSGNQEEESQADHVRVYVPLDLSADAILHRLRFLICRYGEANERNEFDFSMDVGRLVSQIEIYDQVWGLPGRARRVQSVMKAKARSIAVRRWNW